MAVQPCGGAKPPRAGCMVCEFYLRDALVSQTSLGQRRPIEIPENPENHRRLIHLTTSK